MHRKAERERTRTATLLSFGLHGLYLKDLLRIYALLSERFGLQYRTTLNNDAVPTVFDHRKRPQRMPRSASTGLHVRSVTPKSLYTTLLIQFL